MKENKEKRKFMCFKNFSKKLTSFGLAFLFGLLVVGIFQTVDSYNKAEKLLIKENTKNRTIGKVQKDIIYQKQGSGFASCGGTRRDEGIGTGGTRNGYKEFSMFVKGELLNTNNKTSANSFSQIKPLLITYKPKAKYTDEAKRNNVEGSVTVRVVFLASGGIGAITPVSDLPCGLTEQAILAAKQMRFKPQIKNGSPMTVVKSVQFSFTIY